MKKTLFILLTIFCVMQGFAQLSKEHTNSPKGIYTLKGDYYFSHDNYIKAAVNYHKSVNQNKDDTYSKLKLAESYYMLGNDDLACKWYEQAFRFNPEPLERDMLNYIVALFAAHKYEELEKWEKTYNEHVLKSIEKSSEEIYKDSTFLLIKNLEHLNSKMSEISPLPLNDSKLVFTTNLNEDKNNRDDYNIFIANPAAHGEYIGSAPLSSEINKGINNGAIAITSKSNSVYYILTNTTGNELYNSVLSTNSTEGIIANKIEFKFSGRDITDPAITSDGNVLIFSAKDPSNGRGYDLYRTTYNGKKWAKPQLLNEHINSIGDERYPSIHNDSILYFSSNGHKGLGGFDIFKTKLNDDDSPIEHLNFPINTHSNEFGFYLKSDGKEGFLSSNRTGGKGNEDLYKVKTIHLKAKKEEQVQSLNDKSNELAIYTSGGDIIKITDYKVENLAFEFLPGTSYKLYIDDDDYKELKSDNADRIISKMNLSISDIYTFHIQQMIEASIDQNEVNTTVKDIHVKPGDLITFQLVPDVHDFSETVTSKVRIGRTEIPINGKDVIVFGYVAEESSKSKELEEFFTDIDSLVDDEEMNLVSLDEQLDMVGVLLEDHLLENESLDSLQTSVAQLIETNNNESDTTVVNSELIVEIDNNLITSTDSTIAVSADSVEVTALALNDELNTNSTDSTELIPTTELEVAKAELGVQPMALVDSTVAINADSVEVIALALNDEINTNSTDSTELIQTTELEVTKAELGIQPMALVDSTVAINADSVEITALALNDEPISKSDESIKEVQTKSVPVTNIKNDDYLITDIDINSINNDVVQYRVQIAAARSEITNAQLIRIYDGENQINTFQEEGYFKYYIAETPSLMEAKAILKASGVKDAFIMAYKGGIKYNIPSAYITSIKIKDEIVDETSSIVLDEKIVSDSLLIESNLTDTTKSESLTKQASTDNSEIENDVTQDTVLEDEMVGENALNDSTNTIVQDSLLSVAKEVEYVLSDSLDKTPDMVNNEIVNADSTVIEKSLLENDLLVDSTTVNLSDSVISDSQVVKTDEVLVHSGGKVSDQSVQNIQEENANIQEVQIQDSLSLLEYINDSLTHIKALIDTSSQPVVVNKKAIDIDESQISNNMINNPDDLETDQIVYRVQVAAARSEIKQQALSKLYTGDYKVKSFYENGYFKYYITETTNYFLAEKILKASKIKNAFISAYKGDTKWTIDSALAEQYQKPSINDKLSISDSVIKVVTINFEFDAYTITEDEELHLQSYVIDLLKSNSTYNAVVNGFTDIQGSEIYNYGLSQERAYFIMDKLIENGIDSDRVKTQYFGESQLLKYCPENGDCDETIHQANRRAEILLLIPKQ